MWNIYISFEQIKQLQDQNMCFVIIKYKEDKIFMLHYKE